ncbi:unnamed protein product [marine sediment metagenome]|uniref:Uncharacterized protein n=1 Tax=marine sediment metagenome TaxID=412755 RepID=X1SQW1_9ZZZZ
MKLAEFIPQEVDLLSRSHGIQVASETERTLREILINEGDAELDDELVAIMLDRHKKIYHYSEISQKVYWAIFDACMEVLNERKN